MRLPRVFITLVLVFCCVGVTLAQDGKNRRDGNWWRDQARVVRDSYMVGFFDGMELGRDMSTWNSVGKQPNVVNAAVQSYGDFHAKYFGHTTNDQITDGLDEFYADFRNRSIEVHSAVWVVVKQIAGDPKDSIDKLVTNLRRNAL